MEGPPLLLFFGAEVSLRLPGLGDIQNWQIQLAVYPRITVPLSENVI